MTTFTRDERAALNALALRGLHGAAQCVERLLMDGETVLAVIIAGQRAQVEALPPGPRSPLWREAATYKTTAADTTFIATRFGCEIRWTITRAEAELLRIAESSARRTH
jgi:hypothetical protein